ncbi:putative invertase/pectin methylesterase inhibitor domain superfamily [Helianthus annuus]|nr:putative invertase/pectin methylesterase inhibitor domain superfamily [Helianthus annuus]
MGKCICMVATTMAMVIVVMMNTSNAAPENSQFCKFARLKPLCNRMVRGGRNYKEALKNAFRRTLLLNRRNTKLLVPVLTPVVKNIKSPSAPNILKTCKEKVTDITGYINDLIEAVDDDNKDMIEYYLRTGELTLRECVDSITELEVPVPPELSKAAQDVEDYKETALVIFLQAPIETVYNKPMPADYAG